MRRGKVGLRAAKQAVNDGMNVDLKTGMAIEVNQFALAVVSRDSKEGTQAFIDKRKPNFVGLLDE